MIAFKTSIYFYHGGAWALCSDVLQDPPPSWEYGLPGAGPMDLVADTGILTFTLDNTTSNSAGLSGYYSTGHPNCPAWFVDGLPVKVVCERQDAFVSATRFLGEMVNARPTSGVFEEATVEVTAHDWMEYASIQKLGQLAIQTSKRVDQALTTALLNFPATRQPAATDFDAGVETFASIFNTDDSMKQTMASLFQKLARNECAGFIFLEGDGTLRFDNRNTRPATTASAFALDATGASPMNELEVVWDRKAIKNRIEAKLFPARVDAAATTVIWKLQKTFPLSVGQSLTLTCPYRDPATGARISASSVVDPLVEATHIKFGTVDDGTTHDIHTYTRVMDVGGNTAEITLVNENKAATVNNCLNPSFEVNVTDDWTFYQAGAGGSVNVDATQHYVGAKSARIRAGTGNTGIYNAAGVSVPNGSTVTMSFGIRCSADPTGDKTIVYLQATDWTFSTHVHATAAATGAWENLTASITNTSGVAKTVIIAAYNQFNDSAADVWIDAVQLELGPAKPYCDGTLYDCTWSGAAHNSTSSRPAGQAGYVNFIELLGKGIYTYEPMVLASEDAASILLRGERILEVRLEQLTSPNTAETYAASLKMLLANPVLGIERVRFLANFSDAFATAALTAEVNTRFTIAEALTHAVTDVFACRLKYEQEGPHLWVEIVPAPAGADVNYFIWKAGASAPGTDGWGDGRWTI